MAQNNWINVTVDPAAAKKPDNADHFHIVVNSTAAAGDCTFSFDSTKITSLSMARSVIAQILRIISGQLPR